MGKKIDPFTGEEFVPKRSNQKFATEKNKNNYHNKKNRKLRIQCAPIDKKIKKNLLILEALLNGKKETGRVSKEFLRGKGFDFDGFNVRYLYKGEAHQGVYNYVVIKIDDSYFKIINNER